MALSGVHNVDDLQCEDWEISEVFAFIRDRFEGKQNFMKGEKRKINTWIVMIMDPTCTVYPWQFIY